MPSATPAGIPYAIPADPIGDYPDTSQDLAEALDPTFTNVAYAGAWSDFGAPYEEVSYAKVGSVVVLRGSAKHAVTGTTGTVFTLPVGYRPTKTRRFICNAAGGIAVVTVSNLGVVAVAAYAAAGSAATLAFDGIAFDLGA